MLTLFLLIAAAPSSIMATPTISESFSITESPEDYSDNTNFNDPAHKATVVGNAGFSADNAWQHGTANVRPRGFAALDHALVAGDAHPGGALIRGTGGGLARNSVRELAEQPVGNTFYMSGLVHVPTVNHIHINDRMAIGLIGEIDAATWDISTGLHLGVHRDDSGDVYPAAFAAGNTYTLGEPLSGDRFSSDHLIVLRVDLDPEGNGRDTLNPWMAYAGDTYKLHVLMVSDIDVGTVSDFGFFVLQGLGGGDEDTSLGVRFDEFRFGATLGDVRAGGVERTLHLDVNPYADINWQATGQYRAQLHAHTTESDGHLDPAEVIDEYHARGFDILAITDHNMCTWPWEDFGRDPDSLGMLAIPGNELSPHHHTLSLFVDFELFDPDLDKVLTALAAADGLASLCHPAMHWVPKYNPPPYLRTDLTPALREITRGDFTIEAWFRTTDPEENILMGNRWSLPRHPGILNLELISGNQIRIHVNAGDLHETDARTWLVVSAGHFGIDTRDGEWHHLAGVRRDDTVHLFLDGQLIGQAKDEAGSFDLGGEFYYFGHDYHYGHAHRAFNGDMDHVRMWHRGLSDSEVSALASGEYPGSTVGPEREGMLLEYVFETSGGEPVEPGDLEGVVDDTAGHPDGPFPADATYPEGAAYVDPVPGFIDEVAAVLQESGGSGHAMRFAIVPPDAETIPEEAVQQYVDLYKKFDHLISIEVHNATRPVDRDYPLDKALWDRLLTELMPERPVWGLSVDDMHGIGGLGHNWVVFLAPALDMASIREAFVDGAFYFSSTRLHTSGDMEITPRITNVVHDAEKGWITVQAVEDGEALVVDAYQWISEGRVVHTGPTLPYREIAGVGVYARVEINGSHGKTYSNPFGFFESGVFVESDVVVTFPDNSMDLYAGVVLPPYLAGTGTAEYAWTVISGPGPAEFSTTSAQATRFVVSQPGVYEIHVHVALGDYEAERTQTVFFAPYPMQEPEQSFEEWADQEGLPEDERGFSDDPHESGIPNLIAYATGLPPDIPGQTPLRVTESGGRLIFSIPWRTDISSRTYFLLEFSGNLKTWHTEGNLAWDTIEMDPNRVALQGSLPSDVLPRRGFYRVRFGIIP